MKFYGNGIVWNAQANRPLCRFEKGGFITEDESVIKALADLGYKHDEPLIKTIEVVETEPVDGRLTDEVKKEEPEEVKLIEKPKPAAKKPAKRKRAVKKK